MKLLFENWRKYLIEQDDSIEKTQEKYFGVNPDDVPCMDQLKRWMVNRRQDRHADLDDPGDVDSGIPGHPIQLPRYLNPNTKSLVKCMIKAGFGYLGSGSFRAAFSVPDHPELILKVALPTGAEFERNIEMNKKEAQGVFQTASELAPKVFASAQDYFWIMSERVTVIKTWEEMSQFFPVYQELRKRGILGRGEYAFAEIFELLIGQGAEDRSIGRPDRLDPGGIVGVTDYGKVRDAVLKGLQGKGRWEDWGEEELSEPAMQKEDEAITDRLVNNSMFATIRDFLAKFDLPSWDIRPDNVGYTIRDGRKQFVIIDPGFEL